MKAKSESRGVDALARAKRVCRLSRALVALVMVAGAGIALIGAFRALTDLPWFTALLHTNFAVDPGASLSLAQALAIIAILLAEVAVLYLGLYALWRAFGAVLASASITRAMARWMRRAGWAFAASTLLMVLAHPLITLIATAGQPSGKHQVVLSFGTSELMTLLTSVTLIAFAHILLLGAEISDDNSLIV
jgi:hypothetical protein